MSSNAQWIFAEVVGCLVTLIVYLNKEYGHEETKDEEYDPYNHW